SLMILDAMLLLIISISFCANYHTLFNELEKAFGDSEAKRYWSGYNLSIHAATTAVVLIALLTSWLTGWWILYSFLLFTLYAVFLSSNRQLALLLTNDTAVPSNIAKHQQLFLDNLFIVESENLSSLVGYMILFLISAIAAMTIRFLGNIQAA